MTIRSGIVKAFDAGTYTATVQLTGSLAVWLSDLPVARNIPSAEMVAGRRCAVIFFDASNPRDAVVAAVFT
ncbi:unnamed protein product [marine sediment metagenome]|uniref:Uncharacterized protein n=1 Tax=marine sediment metagenome TaxID=412755 RepID=X0XVX7_9ZZZZ